MLTLGFVQMKQNSVKLNELATGFSLLLNKVKSSLHFATKKKKERKNKHIFTI